MGEYYEKEKTQTICIYNGDFNFNGWNGRNTHGRRNFSVAAVKRGDELRFLHKICEGGTDDSYGIEVAKLAGLPQKVINRAKEELVELEKLGRTKLSETIEKTADHQFSFTAINEQNAIAKLRAADINTMSPMDALMFLKDIKDTL